ncbi:hypothetical protein phiMK_89 [Pseudomonas phage phiMK]|uniref:Uncharacterized protein n=3 Tax=Pakpunavirus TaxID=1921407 RepID=A0A9E6U482_9CAUD|nr:hypothetical protein BI047_gp101 [Pseudomonas phage phiMK]YP_010762029.1 hypothetical protein QE322_gp079 [Pseudomonas phage PaGz-1]YP_010763352.1 hypothetical protein QE329_gp150 [Pseudomonas phage PhL_UNISO_PA-DSM_ph0034]UZO33182.1 hypothetical protein CBSLWZGG_CDS152 [Pseudomonas phage PseuPha1]WKC57503.1 hypothetical protein EPA3_086 [Pseudomonas phage vB_PaM_EPA3]AMQ66277.1 hypothetical protein phiMK_89 [Pseudomonas phage phiMK]QAX98145.1 hypothetical protein [Pseudomonas phage PaGz-1
MKLEDVKKGQVVKVNSLNMDNPRPTFEKYNAMVIGVVAGIDKAANNLNIKVLFENGEMDWGNASDVSLVHSDPEANRLRKKKVSKISSKIDELFNEVWEATQS